MRSLILIGVIFLSLCPKVFAQEDKQKKHVHDTYLEGSILHAEGELEGSKYNINGLAVDLETYFNGRHIGLSGWSLGYRKDDLRYSDFGHVFNFKLFRTIPLIILDFKASAGVEWGVPNLQFEKTQFVYDGDGKVLRYKHVSLERNTNIPRVATETGGMIYPFFEAGLVKRYKFILTQVGVRGNILKFRVDKYDLVSESYEPSQRTIVVPSVFVGIGISLK